MNVLSLFDGMSCARLALDRTDIKVDKYYASADIMINGIYWDSKAPAFFNIDEMATSKFNIKVIADITCDIAPDSSIPSTLEAATIKNPVFGFNPVTRKKTDPFLQG